MASAWPALFCFACASAPPSTPLSAERDWVSALVESRAPGTLIDAVFHAPRAAGGVLETGDRLVFEFRIDGEGDASSRFLAFEVLGPAMKDGKRRWLHFSVESHWTVPGTLENRWRQVSIRSPMHRVGIQLYDGQGLPVASSEVHLAEFVGLGQMAACDAVDDSQRVEPSTEDEMEELVDGLVLGSQSLVALLTLAEADELLSDLLWDVIRKPSLFSLIAHLGAKVSLAPDYTKSERLDVAPAGVELPGPFRSLPVTIKINGRVALILELVVTDPQPPASITSGIVAFVGRHPTSNLAVRGRLVGMRSPSNAE